MVIYGHCIFLTTTATLLYLFVSDGPVLTAPLRLTATSKLENNFFFGNFKKVYYIMIMFESFYHPSITYATLFFFFKKKKTHKTILIYIPSILMNSDFASTGS